MDVARELLALAIDGDRAAVTAITRAYLPRVYGLCLRLARDRALAEEATQETFVRALRALPALRSPDRFRSWLLTIAANATKQLLRVRGRHVGLADDFPGRTAADGEAAAARERALDLALAELEPAERELFLRHALEGASIDDLAREYETTTSAMKSRLHRIRSKVRRAAFARLDAEGETP